MKTKPIAILSALVIPLAFALPAVAAPPGKGGTVTISKDRTTAAPVTHTVMKRVGPPGKGFPCRH